MNSASSRSCSSGRSSRLVSAERALEHAHALRDAVDVEEDAAELERDLGAAARVGLELEAGGEVIGRRRAVDQPLGEAELDEHLGARRVVVDLLSARLR